MIKKILKRKKPNNPQIKSYAKAVKKGLSSHHVIPTKNNDWAVKKAGSLRLTKVFKTQEKAVKYGKKIAKNSKSGLFIHKSNGRIKARKDYF